MNKLKGNALIQYSIIVALILAACVPVFLFFGQNIINAFNNYLNVYKGNNEVIVNQNINSSTSSLTNMIAAGSLGGTPEAPIKDCEGETCSIDFGSFALNGIPEDFNDYVQTSGPSGGTDKIFDLIDQIAKQLEDQGKTQQSEEIKRLANIGHNMAKIKAEMEDMIDSCNGDSTCVENLKKQIIKKPEGYDDSVFPFDPNDDFYTSFGVANIGATRSCLKNADKTSCGLYTKISEEYVNLHDKILNDPSFSDEVKGVVQQMTIDFSNMNDEWSSLITTWNSGGSSSSWDPITGESYKVDFFTDPAFDPYAAYQNYNPSTVTDFDSGIICAAGAFNDPGKVCK